MARMLAIRRITTRTILVLGADRDLVMGTGIVVAALSAGTMELMPSLLGAAIWTAVLFLLRLMAKADPVMRQVYMRSRRYRRYYPATATPFGKQRRR